MVDWDDIQESAYTRAYPDAHGVVYATSGNHRERPKWWSEGAEVKEVLARAGDATVIGVL